MSTASSASHEPTPSPTPQDLREMVLLIGGYRISQCIYVAAELGLADRLAAGPMTSGGLAAATGVHAPSLLRVLRMLAGVGVVAQTAPDTFALTALGATLRSDVAGSPSRNVRAQLHPAQWAAWGQLLPAVRLGSTPFEDVHRKGLFDYMAEDDGLARLFDAAMSANTARGGVAIASAYAFAQDETVMDVGGGRGELLIALLTANASLRGALLERPSVVEGARRTLAAAGVGKRCTIVAGDFLAHVPAGASAYLLSHVIHDWDDARAATILRNCREACGQDGRILMFERLLGCDHVAGVAALHVDLEMMVNLGGRERTEAEYRALADKAGLRVARIVPVPGAPDHAIIECVPSGRRASS